MITSVFIRRCGAVAVLALGALTTPLLGQNSTTTGAIRGRVSREGGAPLADATITGRETSTGFIRSARVNAEGDFTLSLLPPGTYTVLARMIGFGADSTINVSVIVGQTATVNFTLSERAVALGAVTVGGERRQTVDVTDASLSQSVSQKEIETLPSLGRDFTDFINISGLVGPNPERTTGGQFSIAGMRPSQTNIQIDGVDANNSFFGENRGGSRIPFEFSLESIREFQVITNGFDVEYGNYTGGVVNVVTRGGSNTLEGTAYANYRGDQTTAKGFDGKPAANFNVEQYAGRISGPIKRDKAFFLFSIDGQRRREPQTPLSPSYFLNKVDATGKATPDTAGANELTQFITALGSKYGIANAGNGYQSFQTTNDVITLFGRVDWNIDSKNRFSIRENFANHVNDNLFGTSSTYDIPYGVSKAERLGDRSSSAVGELQSVVSPTAFNVLRFQYSYEDRPRTGHDLRPALTVLNLGDGQRAGYGGTFISLDNDLTEQKVQVIDNFTHQMGTHAIKFGASGILSHLKNTFVAPTGSADDITGEYTFSTLADFIAGNPSTYTRSETIDGTVPLSRFYVGEYAAYGQDEWRATPRLTATFGLRYDVESFLDSPSRVVDVERAFGVHTGFAPTDKNNVSPRIALAYDVTGKGTSVLRAGAGYFYGRLPYVVGGNVVSSTQPILSLTCAGSAAKGAGDAPPALTGYGSWSAAGTNDPVTCADGQKGTGVPTYTLWKDHFQFPESFKANVGYDKLLDPDTKLAINVIGSQSYKLYTVRNINLRSVQFTLADEGNRQVFVPADAFNPSSATSTKITSALNTDFAPVYVNYNDGQAQSFATSAELSHSFTRNSQIRMSYTFTRAFDNSSYTCCTATEGFTNPTVGQYGPNDIGAAGDASRAWGPSATVRNHVVVISGNAQLPWGLRMSGLWRFQSGDHWTPEQSGDLNGDGVAFNDRVFIFAPDSLPLTETDPTKVKAIRATYQNYLNQYPCVAKYVNQIIPRNTCTQPWFNKMDMEFAKSVRTGEHGQRAELQVDLFNVLNGLKSTWGRYMGVSGSAFDLMTPNSYDAVSKKILYSVPSTFGSLGVTGTNLLLQFQAQIGLKYFF